MRIVLRGPAAEDATLAARLRDVFPDVEVVALSQGPLASGDLVLSSCEVPEALANAVENGVAFESVAFSDGVALLFEIFETRHGQGDEPVIEAIRGAGERMRLRAALAESESERSRLLEAEKAARIAAEEALARLEVMQGITEAALVSSTLDEVLDRLVDRIREILKVDGAAILLASKDANELVVRAVSGDGANHESCTVAFGTGVVGRVAESRQTIVVDDFAAEIGFPCKIFPAASSFVGVPLLVAERLIGVLKIARREPAAFTPRDRERLELVAERVALGIDRALLHEELTTSRERLRALSRSLVDIQETERRRLARELHDDVGQLLTGLKFLLETPSGAVNHGPSPREQRRRVVQDLLERIRTLSTSLRPPMLDDLGLLATLHWHFEQWVTQTGIEVDFHQAGLSGRFPAEIELAAFRIIQEALTNVARHSRTERVRVRLWANDELLGIRIEDDGVGFDVDASLKGQTSGLAGMIERVRLLEGQISIESSAKGTRLAAELPLRPMQ